jgi:hypothetical protein
MLLLSWTGLMVAGTYALVETTVHQQRATKFATTQGRIVRSEMGRGAVSLRGLDIDYIYIVNGVEYNGHHYRYDDLHVPFEWSATVELHPRLSLQTVYYNPKNPADSLLQPGVEGGDLLLLLFALPLNVLTVAAWSAMLGRLKEKSNMPRAGGLKIVKQPGKTEVSLVETSALAAGFYAMAAVAFFATFPILIASRFDPKPHLMKMTWVAVVATGVVVFIWRMLRNLSGIYNLRFDKVSQTVTLPQTAGRKKAVAIPLHEICGVSMERRVSKSPSGTHFSYLPALNCDRSNRESQSIKLIPLGWSEEKARAFSQWLSQELGVEFKGVEEETSGVHC